MASPISSAAGMMIVNCFFSSGMNLPVLRERRRRRGGGVGERSERERRARREHHMASPRAPQTDAHAPRELTFPSTGTFFPFW